MAPKARQERRPFLKGMHELWNENGHQNYPERDLLKLHLRDKTKIFKFFLFHFVFET
jgi:hypothetical protein